DGRHGRHRKAEGPDDHRTTQGPFSVSRFSRFGLQPEARRLIVERYLPCERDCAGRKGFRGKARVRQALDRLGYFFLSSAFTYFSGDLRKVSLSSLLQK